MICYVHCQQVASVEVVEVEVADLAEVVVEVEVADSAEVEEVVDEEEVEVDIPIITIFYGRDELSLIPVTLFNLCSRGGSRKFRKGWLGHSLVYMCCTCSCLSSNHMMENGIFNFIGADLSVNKHLSLN